MIKMLSEKIINIWREDIATVIENDLPWDRLSGCRVLVTGAAGFLGGYLVRTLLHLHGADRVADPITVVALVRNINHAKIRLSDVVDHPNFTMLEWDLNNIALPDIGACNYVLHAASQASPKYYGIDPVGTALPNAVGSAALLSALQKCPDPRGFLFVSSSEIYGAAQDNAPILENDYGVLDPTAVRACYAESKRFAETLCAAWYQQYKLPTFIVRPFHTYGPGLQLDDGRVFADFAFNVLRGENISMDSDGTARRAFCYASDAVVGFFTVLLKGECVQPYNVANPSAELSVLELAKLMIGLYPEKKLKIISRATPNRSSLTSNVNRLLPNASKLVALGWKPVVTPILGFRRMIEAYQT